MDNCIFCKIIENRADAVIIYRDDLCTAFLDIHPINPGHALVLPNRHAEGFSQLTPEEVARLMQVAQKIVSASDNEATNIFLSDGTAAGQEVPHTHLHVVPRYSADGQKFQFFHHTASRAELEQIAALLRPALCPPANEWANPKAMQIQARASRRSSKAR